MKQPHADVIHAWADGADIEYQVGSKWVEFDPQQLPFSQDRSYRIKPDRDWYRVGSFANGDISLARTTEEETKMQAKQGFLRWVTERTYVDER